MQLSEIMKTMKFGQKLLIASFSGDTLFMERLHEMGLRPGMMIEYWGRAPFRGPGLFKFRNTMLALREEEASCARVEFL